MRRNSICDQFAEQLRAMAANGTNMAAAARTVGVHRATLQNWARNEGLVFQAPVGGTHLARATPTGEVSREEILESQLKELQAAVRTDRRASVAQERIIRAVESALATYEPPSLVFTPEPVPTDAEMVKRMANHHRQLVMLSDFHGGERVNRQAVNGLNEYDWEIMLARVDELVDGLISFQRNSPALTGLDVLFIGDMCSGSNHEELARTNVYPLTEQGIKMGYVQADILRRLSPHYADLRVLSVEGNHPRLSQKPAAKQSWDNMDYVASIIAKEATKDIENISEFRVGSGAEMWEIAGNNLYVWHGDGVRSSMPGVPWGGVMRRTNEIRRAHARTRIDGFLLGHFHQANAMLDLGIFMNGALKGVDEWCLKSFGGGARPTQLLLMFDEKSQRLVNTSMLTPQAGL